MTLAGSDAVEFAYSNGATTTIAIDSGGILNATSTNFYADNATYSTNQILVQGDAGRRAPQGGRQHLLAEPGLPLQRQRAQRGRPVGQHFQRRPSTCPSRTCSTCRGPAAPTPASARSTSWGAAWARARRWRWRPSAPPRRRRSTTPSRPTSTSWPGARSLSASGVASELNSSVTLAGPGHGDPGGQRRGGVRLLQRRHHDHRRQLRRQRSTATGTNFFADNTTYSTNQILVQGDAGGGHLTAVGGTSFALNSLAFQPGSYDTLSSASISSGTILTVNSGATVNVHGNDFTNVGSKGSSPWAIPVPRSTSPELLGHVELHPDPGQDPRPLRQSRHPPDGELTARTWAQSPASITGVVFNDLNGDGVQDAGEPGLAGVLVYLDVNNTGSLVGSDPSTVTNSSGQYRFDGLAAGTYVVREVGPGRGRWRPHPSRGRGSDHDRLRRDRGESGITGRGRQQLHVSGRQLLRRDRLRPRPDRLCSPRAPWPTTSARPPRRSISASPSTSATFFYVHGSGYRRPAPPRPTTWTATCWASVSSKAATTKGDPANFVTLSVRLSRSRGSRSSAASIDNFTFNTAANNQAYFVHARRPGRRPPGATSATSTSPAPSRSRA